MTGQVVAVEAVKVRAAPVMWWTTLLTVFGVVGLSLAFIKAAQAGSEQVIAQLGPLATEDGWVLFLGLTAQLAAAGTVIGFGIGAGWIFGREFHDHTLPGLFAQPVSLGQVAVAKLVIYGLWVGVVSTAVTVSAGLSGWALISDPVNVEVALGLGRVWVLIMLSGGLAVVAAWAVSHTRSLFAGVGASLGVVFLAQGATLTGVDQGAWVPFAAPTLWTVMPGGVSGGQLALSLSVPVTFGILTWWRWHRLVVD